MSRGGVNLLEVFGALALARFVFVLASAGELVLLQLQEVIGALIVCVLVLLLHKELCPLHVHLLLALACGLDLIQTIRDRIAETAKIEVDQRHLETQSQA
jgi:hypothetical protein